MQSRHRGPQLGLLLLASQVYQVGTDNIPPVTLAVLALNVYLYIFPLAPLMQTCVSVETAYLSKEWRRLLLSPLHHVDDWHLCFNMVSLIWKGQRLERRLGGHWFVYLLCVFSLLTGLVYLVLEAVLTELSQDQSYSMSCAVGFSGVLFALKVLNNHYYPGDVTYLMGAPVSNRYACWAELVLIHIISPQSSFVGHLAGILVGLLYTAGPLKALMETAADYVTSNGYNARPRTYYRFAGSSGHSGRRQHEPADRTASYTEYEPADRAASYTGGLSEEEQLQAAIGNSLNDQGQSNQTEGAPPDGFHVPDEARAEEIRRLRLRRFDR